MDGGDGMGAGNSLVALHRPVISQHLQEYLIRDYPKNYGPFSSAAMSSTKRVLLMKGEQKKPAVALSYVHFTLMIMGTCLEISFRSRKEQIDAAIICFSPCY